MNLEVEYGGVAEATVDTQGIRLPSKDEPLDREAAEFVKRATMDSDEEDSAEEDSAEERENAESDLLGAVNNRCHIRIQKRKSLQIRPSNPQFFYEGLVQ